MDETIRVNTADDTAAIPRPSQEPQAAAEPAKIGVEDLTLEDYDHRPDNAADPDVANLVGQLGRLGFNLMALPLNLLPTQSRYHAKNSLREGFMAFKSLVDEVATGIDESIVRTRQAATSPKIKVEDASFKAPDKIKVVDDDEIVGEGAV